MAQVRTQQFPKVPGDQGIGDKQHGGQPLPTLPETPIDDPVRMPIRPGSGRPGEGGVPQTAGAMTGVPGGGDAGVYFGAVTGLPGGGPITGVGPGLPYRIRKTGEGYGGLIINYGGIWYTTRTGAYEGNFSLELDPTGVGPGDPQHLKIDPANMDPVRMPTPQDNAQNLPPRSLPGTPTRITNPRGSGMAGDTTPGGPRDTRRNRNRGMGGSY